MKIEKLRFVVSLSLRFALWIVLILYAIGVVAQQGYVVQQPPVAQQQPQKPKLHGFKAHLCAMSTGRNSPAFDNCMAERAFGHQHPSQPAQPAASQPQVAVASQPQVAPPQAKSQEPVVKDTPVQAKTCIEYMTTSSGAQTCLRWKGDD